jgi:hypothetical protein
MIENVNGVLIFFKPIVNNSWKIQVFIYIFTHFKIAQIIT